MCGIAGIVLRDAQTIDPDFAKVQAHRGPDRQGMILSDGETITFHSRIESQLLQSRLALIHHRLSIIDLSDLGRQPMSTPDRRYHLIYNGEVYNYVELRKELEAVGVRFFSQSDTEVVLHALAYWGKESLSRFEGMFALALWDAQSRTLLLARDFFGIKPLHYHQTDKRFAFSSEMKALMQLNEVDRNLDPRATFRFLRHGLTDDDRSTLLHDIRQLEPGCWMELHLDRPGHATHGRYWQLERSAVDLSFADAAAHLRSLFLRNIKRHLRADVRVGTALSGGIDSSAIVSAVRHVEPDIDLHTFSYVTADEGLSEEAWVDIVAQHTGATVHKIRVGADDLIADLDELIDAQDQPFGSTSIYAQFSVFRAARDANIKVMLDGQGADEIFGGYSNFLGARLASMLLRGELVEATRFLYRAGGEVGLRQLVPATGPYLLPARLQRPLRWLVGRELFPGWLNRDWFRATGNVSEGTITRELSGTMYADELIRATTISLPHLLRYEDQNSMHFSIESRVPFLTSDFAGFSVSVPEEYSLAADGTHKALFRHAMRGIVPDSILDRRDKIGFATPERTWLSQLGPWVDSVLADARGVGQGPIDVVRLEQEWDAVRSGRKRFDNHIWRCLNLVVWAQRNAVSLGVA
jgi:asparagine synthase (glutamine-hydrolysing)